METPPRKRTHATEERQGEVKGKMGPHLSRPTGTDNMRRVSNLEQWLSGGSPSGPTQVEREDVPGTSSGKKDGASTPTQSSTHGRREGIGNRKKEKGNRASNKRKIDENLATTIGKEETDQLE